MQRNDLRISFWTALAVALTGAALLHSKAASALVPGSLWAETLRPLLIAATLLALATAATLAYGGSSGHGPSGFRRPRLERPALWTVALLSLASLFLFLR